CGLGRQAPADGIRMGSRRWAAGAGWKFSRSRPASAADGKRRKPVRRCVGLDALVLRPLSRLQAVRRCGCRVQRQIHGGSGGAARRFVRDAAWAHTCHLPQFLSPIGTLAVQRHPARGGRMTNATLAYAKALQAARPKSDFENAVLSGLARTPKELPCKFFYDAEGSALFDRICELPEYYPTRTETALLRSHAPEFAEFIGPDAEVIEFGAGSLQKI